MRNLIQSSNPEIELRRKAELENEGTKILGGMASRIDRGYQIDGDASEPEGGSEEDNKRVAEIKSLADQIRHIEPPEDSVLQLPSPEDGAENETPD